MALLIETGYGSVGAESYASVEQADAYWAARINPEWAAATLEQKEAALRMASEYLDLNHLGGPEPLVDGQGLTFPYYDVELSLSHMALVRRATIMIAPWALAGPLVAQVPPEGPLIQRTDKVGELSESRTFAQPISAPVVVAGRDFSFLYRMLAPLGGPGGLVIGRRQRS